MNTRAHLRTIALPQILHHQLRIVAVTQNRKINDITEEAVRQWLMRNASQVPSSADAQAAGVSSPVVGSLGQADIGLSAGSASGALRFAGSVGVPGNLPTQLHGEALGSDALDEDAL